MVWDAAWYSSISRSNCICIEMGSCSADFFLIRRGPFLMRTRGRVGAGFREWEPRAPRGCLCSVVDINVAVSHVSKKITYTGAFKIGAGLLSAAKPPSRLSRDGPVGGERPLTSGTLSVIISILIGISGHSGYNRAVTQMKEYTYFDPQISRHISSWL